MALTGFLAPARLWLLLAPVALLVVYVVLQRRRPADAVRFSELELLASVLPRRAAWKRHVPPTLLLLSVAALTTAFARPEADVQVPREEAVVVLALDVSISMRATDVAPDRITSAQSSAARFVEGLPEGFSVGLVAFSGAAAVVVPPTQDHAAVVNAVGALQLGPSTAIGEAVSGSKAHPEIFTEFVTAETASTLPMGTRPDSVINGCAPATTTVLHLSTVVAPSPLFMA